MNFIQLVLKGIILKHLLPKFEFNIWKERSLSKQVVSTVEMS